MPSFTLNQAAKESGKSKAAIIAALRSGRLSGVKNEIGQWQIEPVELFRVYPVNQSPTTTLPGNENRHLPPEYHQPTTQVTTLLEQQMAQLTIERDRERQQLQSTIDDLRQRLNKADDAVLKLTALLTYQSQPKTPEKAATGSRLTWLVILLALVSVGAVLALRFGLIS